MLPSEASPLITGVVYEVSPKAAAPCEAPTCGFS